MAIVRLAFDKGSKSANESIDQLRTAAEKIFKSGVTIESPRYLVQDGPVVFADLEMKIGDFSKEVPTIVHELSVKSGIRSLRFIPQGDLVRATI